MKPSSERFGGESWLFRDTRGQIEKVSCWLPPSQRFQERSKAAAAYWIIYNIYAKWSLGFTPLASAVIRQMIYARNLLPGLAVDSSSFSDSSVGISCFASALQIYLPHLAQTKACLECSRTGQRSLHGSFMRRWWKRIANCNSQTVDVQDGRFQFVGTCFSLLHGWHGLRQWPQTLKPQTFSSLSSLSSQTIENRKPIAAARSWAVLFWWFWREGT